MNTWLGEVFEVNTWLAGVSEVNGREYLAGWRLEVNTWMEMSLQ